MANNDLGFYIQYLDNKLDSILQCIEPLAGIPIRLNSIEDRLTGVENELRAVKAAVKDHSGELEGINTRLSDHGRQLAKLQISAS